MPAMIPTLISSLLLAAPITSFAPSIIPPPSSPSSSSSLGIFGEAFDKAFEEEGPLGKGITVGKLQIALSLSSSERSSPDCVLRLLETAARDDDLPSKYDDATYDYGGDSHLSKMCHSTCLALMRKSEDWISACSEWRWFKGGEGGKAESLYNQWSDREAAKFEKEYIPDQSLSSSTSPASPTVAVISLIIEIQGDSTDFSRAGFSISETKDILSCIMADCRVDNGDCLNAVEVFWTPSDSGEVLTERDTVLDFPELISF